jgi:NTE family protein
VPVLRGTAQHIASYDDSLRRYIHFVDGALSDNLGGRVAYRALVANTDFSIMRVLEREAGVAHRVVVIVVDARPRERTYIEERADVPGEAAVLSSVFSIPMTRYSDETIFRLEERIDLMNQHDPRNQVGSRENRFYFTRVAMENVDDAATRLALNAIPTAFTIPAASVDRLVTAGGMLLRDAEGFKRLVADLRASRH